ncbi:hypothetical protein SAE02_71800 [Skermanella aerolata]|uniref:Uncharacterized protein n=1 Tax=Skermanella aerolata TaxID=393310 RepID=A0A512E2S3_9PROT|nr:hypothetical protein [Skermanella aerolata]GEO43032.1 hypothetical protein SAE02_71800 [Skermanella aerolata]
MLAQIRQALETDGDRRSPLQQWMASNFDDLSTMLADARPNWNRLTQAFMAAGFRNLDGSDLQPGSVRQTWYRVRRRKLARQSRTSIPAPTVEVLSPITQPAAKTAQPPDDDPMAALRAEMNRRSGRI